MEVLTKRIVPISYTDEYKVVMEEFWNIYSREEVREGALGVTKNIITNLCEGHYTVWQYRRYLLRELKMDLSEELAFVRQYTVERPKNYQLWRHREALMNVISTTTTATSIDLDFLLECEFNDLELALMDEPKNYHAWQYRQWLVKHFNKCDKELSFVNMMLEQDQYNNSAWNHRRFVYSLIPIDLISELKFTRLFKQIQDVPNVSLTNYLNWIATVKN